MRHHCGRFTTLTSDFELHVGEDATILSVLSATWKLAFQLRGPAATPNLKKIGDGYAVIHPVRSVANYTWIDDKA